MSSGTDVTAKKSITDAIAILEAAIADPSEGLPQEIFYFMTRITPLVNVDLLIKDPDGRVMLAWRADEFAGSGWHVPGGILRYKESLADRIMAVARQEIGRDVRIRPAPIAINQLWKKSATRGHFVSILFECFTDEQLEPDNSGHGEGEAGFLQWHDQCPTNLIEVHQNIYQHFIGTKGEIPDFSGDIPASYYPDL